MKHTNYSHISGGPKEYEDDDDDDDSDSDEERGVYMRLSYDGFGVLLSTSPEFNNKKKRSEAATLIFSETS